MLKYAAILIQAIDLSSYKAESHRLNSNLISAIDLIPLI